MNLGARLVGGPSPLWTPEIGAIPPAPSCAGVSTRFSSFPPVAVTWSFVRGPALGGLGDGMPLTNQQQRAGCSSSPDGRCATIGMGLCRLFPRPVLPDGGRSWQAVGDMDEPAVQRRAFSPVVSTTIKMAILPPVRGLHGSDVVVHRQLRRRKWPLMGDRRISRPTSGFTVGQRRSYPVLTERLGD